MPILEVRETFIFHKNIQLHLFVIMFNCVCGEGGMCPGDVCLSRLLSRDEGLSVKGRVYVHHGVSVEVVVCCRGGGVSPPGYQCKQHVCWCNKLLLFLIQVDRYCDNDGPLQDTAFIGMQVYPCNIMRMIS